MPGGLDDQDVAHGVRHHLARHRPEELAFRGAETPVADDDEVLGVLACRLQQSLCGRARDDPLLERPYPLPDGQLLHRRLHRSFRLALPVEQLAGALDRWAAGVLARVVRGDQDQLASAACATPAA